MSALDWNQLATLIGLAGIISGAVSAGTNYVIEHRKEKEKRGAEVAKEQIELYSAFIYNLGILTAAWRSFFSKDKNERDAAKNNIKNITDKIDPLLQNKIHLLNPGLLMTWSVVRQNLELPDVEEHALQSLESLKRLITNLQKEFYSNIIIKYERVAAKFGYVEPLRDPYYLQDLKTNLESMIKAFDSLEVESSKAQQLTAVAEEAVQLGNKMHEDMENAHKIMKEREKEAELKQGDKVLEDLEWKYGRRDSSSEEKI